VLSDSGERALVFDGPPPRNLLMISIDTFRRDHLGRHSAEELTPFLDRIATEGVSLDQLSQCSNWTFASVTCTLMGRYNLDAELIPGLSGMAETFVPDGTPFLASYLGDLGFYSILKSTNYNLGDEKNNAQGYDDVEKTTGKGAGVVWSLGVETLDAALASSRPPDRWFLHLHVVEPHEPYAPPGVYLSELAGLPDIPVDLTKTDQHESMIESWDTFEPEVQEALLAHMRVRYRGEIQHIDNVLSLVWADAEARGLLDDTLVVFWSDHGEQFFEHGNQRHGYHLHSQENDAFALFWAKNLAPVAWTGPTSAVDIVPTILDAFGAEMPDEVTGIPVGGGHPDRPRFGLTVARLGVLQSVLLGRHRLIFSWDGTIEFHDTIADPEELDNRFDPTDPMVQSMWALLEPKVRALEPLLPKYSVSWPEGL
jgi:arylsulfatase A-like enzyme